MTQYVGCDHARTLLEGLIDGELSMADQLAVESHLRWCDTCTRRVEDMRLIGGSLRATSAAQPAEGVDDGALTALTESMLVRVRAERAQSFPTRVREMVADSRLLWPAIGATAAVLLCVTAASSVLRASTIQEPDSLAAMISALGSPGSEMRPLRPADNGISFPRLSEEDSMSASGMIEQIPEEDVIYAFRTVIGRDGSLADWELLSGDNTAPADSRAVARVAAQEMALLNAVSKTRFVPAQTPLGHAVAVDMVFLIAKTTVAAPGTLRSRPANIDTRVKGTQKPAGTEPAAPPVSGQPVMLPDSTPA